MLMNKMNAEPANSIVSNQYVTDLIKALIIHIIYSRNICNVRKR